MIFFLWLKTFKYLLRQMLACSKDYNKLYDLEEKILEYVITENNPQLNLKTC